MNLGFDKFSLAILALSVVIMFIGAVVLSRPGWFLGWIRGNIGFGIVACSAALSVMAFNVSRFQTHDSQRPLATVSVEALANGRSRLTITTEVGDQIFKDLSGKSWSMTFRVVTWGPLPTSLGLPAGYRMESLVSRIDATGDNIETVDRLALMEPDLFFDAWRVLEGLSGVFSWIRADRFETHGIPLEDGAMFTVHQNGVGLRVLPINQRAEVVLNRLMSQ